ncbi:MAG: hypothetical protein A3F17_03360 [Gammaproteobacteria bacterium RIFCSPHIGHO2_12_FULL_41_15]|nr:MAG: hypothetical protein A3F17_03360 [Gammaproteobacteria bacterium RIFCSPHIGHO2_12_FULL_41_15]
MSPKMLREQGLSLLEVLLSLSIIAIILIMATRYFFVASHNDKVNITVSQIGGLIAAVHNYNGADPNYSNMTIEKLSVAGQLVNFPGFDGHETLKTMWGDVFTLQANATNITLKINLPDTPTCEALMRAFPSDPKGSVTSECNEKTFNYTFS